MTRIRLYRGVGGIKEWYAAGALVKSIVFGLFIVFILGSAIGMVGYGAWKYWP